MRFLPNELYRTMDLIELRDYCLNLPYTEETTPFDETTLVFKVCGKMFALADMEAYDRILLKCDPDRAIELREQYPEVTAGYHMNKRHWNGINPHGDLPEELIKAWILDSYRLVISGLPKKARQEIEEAYQI